MKEQKNQKSKKIPAQNYPPGIAGFLRKAWHFIWYDDSLLSWIVNILLAYIIIKFLVYPVMGLVLGTNFPIVAVVSNSMEHRTGPECKIFDSAHTCLDSKNMMCGKEFDAKKQFSLDEYWDACGDYYMAINITRTEFEQYDFKNGFNKGDIMLLLGKKPKDIQVGDIIVFQSKMPYPIIHRVIQKDDKGMWVFQTKGDHNVGQIRNSAMELDETQVLETKVLGKAVLRIPYVGYVKIWFVELLQLVGLYPNVN